MYLIDKIKHFFDKDSKVENYFNKPVKKIENNSCNGNCGVNFYCDGCGKIPTCSWIKKDLKIDKSKPSILIIDDNPGLVSFLRDDIESIFDKNHLDIDDFNIIEFTSKFTAYTFIATHQYFDGLNIKYAIIDITLGGSVQTYNGNIRLTGVDVFKEIYRIEGEDLKFVFYTGNQLNPYIKSNRELIEQFKNIYHDNIIDHVMYKTTMSMDKRRETLNKILFEGI